MERAAAEWAHARDAALAGALPRERRDRANHALMRVERVLARPSGLKSRPWYRSLVYASDIDNGYSTMVFPGVGEAVRSGDQRQADLEIGELAARLNAAAQALVNAAEALEPPSR
jgi:N-acetylated-alpha-linked acidic dipeptidase